MQAQPKYRFYATLLDCYSDYINSDAIWNKYWGFCENPPHTPEEFKQKQFQQVIDRINRVPFDSEAADKGTAFNEVVDCMVEHRNSDKVKINRIYKPAPTIENWKYVGNGEVNMRHRSIGSARLTAIEAQYNNRVFVFDIDLCRKFAYLFKGALTQQLVSAILPTSLGIVDVYGYIDELMPLSVHDIKTTGSYFVGKFKTHWQHIAYPYCLYKSGSDVRLFEYNIAEIDKYDRWKYFKETYLFNPDRDVPILTAHCEDFIRFIEDNRHLITDKKIFNLPIDNG